MSSIKLTFTGDFFFSPILYGEKPNSIISDEVKNIFDNTDYSIINLEAPICEKKDDQKIVKTGPHMNNPRECIDTIKYLNTNLACLANNHILDYDEFGIKETLKACKENNIATVGAGTSLKDAEKICYVSIKDKKIAFVNITENEWSVASEYSAGANPYNIINTVYQINEAKNNADIVILIIHGGHEDYSLPSPRMKKDYRFFIDSGANAVIAHHTHCFCGHEIYNSAPIFYSLGNFLFPLKQKASDEWYEGIIANLEIDSDNKIEFEISPYVQCKGNKKIELLKGAEKERFLNNCKEKESIIQDDKELQTKWEDYIKRISKYYYNIFSTSNSLRSNFLKKIAYRLGLQKTFLYKTYLKNLINAVQCEAHRDASLYFLNNFLRSK